MVVLCSVMPSVNQWHFWGALASREHRERLRENWWISSSSFLENVLAAFYLHHSRWQHPRNTGQSQQGLAQFVEVAPAPRLPEVPQLLWSLDKVPKVSFSCLIRDNLVFYGSVGNHLQISCGQFVKIRCHANQLVAQFDL